MSRQNLAIAFSFLFFGAIPSGSLAMDPQPWSQAPWSREQGPRGANEGPEKDREKVYHPLFMAARDGNADEVRRLIKQDPASIHLRGGVGRILPIKSAARNRCGKGMNAFWVGAPEDLIPAIGVVKRIGNYNSIIEQLWQAHQADEQTPPDEALIELYAVLYDAYASAFEETYAKKFLTTNPQYAEKFLKPGSQGNLFRQRMNSITKHLGEQPRHNDAQLPAGTPSMSMRGFLHSLLEVCLLLEDLGVQTDRAKELGLNFKLAESRIRQLLDYLHYRGDGRRRSPRLAAHSDQDK